MCHAPEPAFGRFWRKFGVCILPPERFEEWVGVASRCPKLLSAISALCARPVELWECVQAVMGARFAKKHRRMTHDFAFSGLSACSKCCCSVVGQIKKQGYVYYHCTGYADKCKGNPATCRRKYVREGVLEQQFTSLLGRLHFDDEVLSWVQEALRASRADKRRELEEAIARLRAEYGPATAPARYDVRGQARWARGGPRGLHRVLRRVEYRPHL
jgi:hypothetical protein